VPDVTLCRVAGYRHSHRGRQQHPMIRSTRTLRIRQTYGLDCSTATAISPPPTAAIITRYVFHELSRAGGPWGQTCKGMSATPAGTAKLEGEEGIDGLAEASLVAGAKRAVGGLPDVNDSATDTLMRSSYTRLANGEDKASALRDAKLGYLHRLGDRPRPTGGPSHYWAMVRPRSLFDRGPCQPRHKRAPNSSAFREPSFERLVGGDAVKTLHQSVQILRKCVSLN